MLPPHRDGRSCYRRLHRCARRAGRARRRGPAPAPRSLGGGLMRPFHPNDKNPSPRALLPFGLVMLVGGAIGSAALHFSLGRPRAALVVLGLSALILAATPVRPVSRRLYFAWMALGL